jgi:hypothetical protein
MTSRLSDLTAALFEQLHRLNDDKLTPEQLETEVTRATAMTGIADRITDVANTQISAAKLFAAHGAQVLPHLPTVGSDSPRLTASPAPKLDAHK